MKKNKEHTWILTIVADRLSCHEAHMTAPRDHLHMQSGALVVLASEPSRSAYSLASALRCGRAHPPAALCRGRLRPQQLCGVPESPAILECDLQSLHGGVQEEMHLQSLHYMQKTFCIQ